MALVKKCLKVNKIWRIRLLIEGPSGGVASERLSYTITKLKEED